MQVTVDQYFFTSVYYVVDTIVDQLVKNPNQHFICASLSLRLSRSSLPHVFLSFSLKPARANLTGAPCVGLPSRCRDRFLCTVVG